MPQYLVEIDGYDSAAQVGTSPATTFTRASVAYKQDGSQVAAGAPRYEKGQVGEGIMIEEGTTNLSDLTLLPYNNYPAELSIISILLTETFNGQQIKRLTYTPLTIAERDRIRTIPSSHGCYVNTAYTYAANTGYYASILWRCSKNGVLVDGSPTNVFRWDSFKTEYVGNGWYRSQCRFIPGVSVPDYKYWGFVDPTIEVNESLTIDWVCPQLEQKAYVTTWHSGTRNPDYLTVPTAGILSAVKGTIELWVKPQMVVNANGTFERYIIGPWSAQPDSLYVYIYNTGEIFFKAGSQYVTANGVTTQLQHVAVAWRGTDRWLYINGQLAGHIPYGTNFTLQATLLLGNHDANGTYAINGLLDDVRFSSRVRTAAEIAETHRRGLLGIPVPWDDATTAIYRFDVAGVRRLNYCTGEGYISGDTSYLPRVQQPGNIKVSMFKEGTTGGASEFGIGDISLVNLDGGLDHIAPYGFDGRKITLKKVDSTGLPVLATLTQEQPVFSWDDIAFRTRDYQALLNVPLQPNKYLGNNVLPDGLEGVADIKGRPKPLLWGEVHNISPVLVNTSKLTYQVRDGAVASIDNVYDKGVALTPGANYATSALLQAATPAAGTFDTCLAEGYFRLGSTPAGDITADVKQGATAADRTTAQIAKAIVTRVIAAADVYGQGIIAVDAANSAVIGIYVDSETTVAAVLDEVCASIGCWYNFDGNGKWNLRQFTAPGSNPVAELNGSTNLTIERLQTNDQGRGVPAYRYILEYDKNYTVQTDLAGSSNRGPYASLEYRTATPAVDAAVQTKHLQAIEMNAQSLLVDPVAAAAEATRRLNLYKVDRDRYKVGAALDALKYPGGGWWDDNSISEMPSPRCGHAAVVHNNYLYVIGGSMAGLGRMTSVIRLDLSNPTGAWDDAGVTDLPAANVWMAAAVYGNWLYVIGGDLAGAFDTRAMRLDLANPTGAWDETVTWPGGYANLIGHSVVVHSHYLYCLGGAAATVQRLDLDNPTGAWDDVGVTDLPAVRSLMTAMVYGNYLYVIGGKINNNPSASTIRLDLTNPSGAWDDAGVTNLPVARYGAGSALVGSQLYLMGGVTPLVSTDNTALKLDLAAPAGAWITGIMANLPEGRVYPSAVPYAGSIYLVGGYNYNQVAVPNTYRYRSNDNYLDRSKLWEIGQDIRLKIPRYGLDAGKVFKIIGYEINLETEQIMLDLWG